MSDVATSAPMAPRSTPIPAIATISGRPVAPKSARPTVCRGPRSRSQRRAGVPRVTTKQREEERREAEAGRREQAVEIEGHPGDDEVDRDQEPEADPLEPHAHRGTLRSAQGQADDEAAGEGAEDEVEADLDREEDEGSEHEHREAHRCLPRRVHRLLEHPDDPGRARPERSRRNEQHDGAEAQQEQRLGDCAVRAGEEDRDRPRSARTRPRRRSRAPPSRAASGAARRRRGSGRACRAPWWRAPRRAARARRRGPP